MVLLKQIKGKKNAGETPISCGRGYSSENLYQTPEETNLGMA